MASEKEGIDAIIALQALAGIKESRKDARAGWYAMTPHMRSQTMLAYRALVGNDPYIIAKPKKSNRKK